MLLVRGLQHVEPTRNLAENQVPEILLEKPLPGRYTLSYPLQLSQACNYRKSRRTSGLSHNQAKPDFLGKALNHQRPQKQGRHCRVRPRPSAFEAASEQGVFGVWGLGIGPIGFMDRFFSGLQLLEDDTEAILAQGVPKSSGSTAEVAGLTTSKISGSGTGRLKGLKADGIVLLIWITNVLEYSIWRLRTLLCNPAAWG